MCSRSPFFIKFCFSHGFIFCSVTGKPYKGFTSPPGNTNIIYLDEYTVITSSDKSIRYFFFARNKLLFSGVRFWDLRKQTKIPYRMLNIPERRESKQKGQFLSFTLISFSLVAGIASMDVNRFSSSLFVAVTDNNIYEFLIGSGIDSPVRRLTHAYTADYDLTVAFFIFYFVKTNYRFLHLPFLIIFSVDLLIRIHQKLYYTSFRYVNICL